jgi:TusA-related sulfurtransferase
MSVNVNTEVDAKLKEIVIDTVVDATGLKCPLPLLKLKQALRDCNIDHFVELLSSDEGSLRDVPKWIEMVGLELTTQTINDAGITSFIVKKII